jgi:peptidoglycan/LPS O-acetylase OafA/YrhL
LKYRAEIDGLRAVAVVPVILFHAGFELFSGGFVGVDVFFVISGYLITSILIGDIEKNQFSIVNFYERRARRLLPALFLVMLVSIPFAWMWMFNQQLREYYHSLIAVSFFVSNILFWKQDDYFAAASEEKPLLHTWSLAVEEQYYVLFPLFLVFVWRFGRNRVFWMIVVLSILSLILSEIGWRHKPTANFYLSPTRAWELFSGSICAFIIQQRGVQVSNIMSGIGLLAIIYSIFIYDENTLFPSIYALVPVMGVALLILYADRETLVAKLLSTKVFVGIGLISYSAYLWHQPILAFAKLRNFGDVLPVSIILILIALTFLLAFISWKYVEVPVRKRKVLASTKSIFLFSLLGIIGFSSLGYWGHLNHPLGQKKYPSFLESSIPYAEYESDNYYLIAESWTIQKEINGLPFFVVDNVAKERELLFDLKDSRKKLLVTGNSHSVDFFNALYFSKDISHTYELARFGVQIRKIDDEYFNSPNYLATDVIALCSLMSEEDLDHLERVIERATKDNKNVVVCKNMFTWMYRENYTRLDRLIIDGALDGVEAKALADKINQQYTKDYKEGNYVSPEYANTANLLDQKLDKLEKKYNITVLDRMEYVCPESGCKIVSENLGKYFFDMGHHTLNGAKYFGKTIDDIGFSKQLMFKE